MHVNKLRALIIHLPNMVVTPEVSSARLEPGMLGRDDGSWWNDCKINLWNINQEHSGKFPWLCKIDFLCIHARNSNEGMPRDFRWLYPRPFKWLCVCCGVMGTKVEFEWQLSPRLIPFFCCCFFGFLFFIFIFFKCEYDIHYILWRPDKR